MDYSLTLELIILQINIIFIILLLYIFTAMFFRFVSKTLKKNSIAVLKIIQGKYIHLDLLIIKKYLFFIPHKNWHRLACGQSYDVQTLRKQIELQWDSVPSLHQWWTWQPHCMAVCMWLMSCTTVESMCAHAHCKMPVEAACTVLVRIMWKHTHLCWRLSGCRKYEWVDAIKSPGGEMGHA